MTKSIRYPLAANLVAIVRGPLILMSTRKKRQTLWLFIIVPVLVIIAMITGPLWIPYVFAGSPRNQHIDSRMIERRVAVGMTKQQVMTALHLPQDTMTACARSLGKGETEVEIVGSSPPWQNLRPGYHTMVLLFDRHGRVARGRGIWWASGESDSDALTLHGDPIDHCGKTQLSPSVLCPIAHTHASPKPAK